MYDRGVVHVQTGDTADLGIMVLTHTLPHTHAHTLPHTHAHTLPQGSLDDSKSVLITVEGDMTRMKDRSPTRETQSLWWVDR